jgi:hypothetical protein
MASPAVDADAEPLPPPPPPSTEEEEEEGQQQPPLDGTRVFGEGAEAASALVTWAASAARLPPLRTLDLRFSDEIDGQALACLGSHARGLTSLRLDGCRNVVTSISKTAEESTRKDDEEKDDDAEKDETQQHSAPELAAVLARSSKTLRSLSLYWIPRLPSDVVYAVAAACRNLTSLNLSGCTRAVDDNALLALAASLGGSGGGGGGRRSESASGNSGSRGGNSSGGSSRGLRRLDLTRCQLLTDPGMARAFRLMPRLQDLRLYAVESFGDEAARALCVSEEKSEDGNGNGNGSAGGDKGNENDDKTKTETEPSFSRLEVLDVCGARDLSDAAAAELVAKRCRGALKVLGCGWVPNVGNKLAEALARFCPSLESLSFHGNRNLTDQGFDALVSGLSPHRKLRALDVRGCVGVAEAKRSKEALRELFGEQLVEFALQR